MSTNRPNQPPPAQRSCTDSNGSRRGSRNSSRNESRRNSSSHHNSDRSRERRGALLLGKNAAGDGIGQLEILSDAAPVVVIAMKGDGDKQCDRVFLWGKENSIFFGKFACTSKKNPPDLLGISRSKCKNRYSTKSKIASRKTLAIWTFFTSWVQITWPAVSTTVQFRV